MNMPKMIIFDYGQTLVDEKSFDALKGTKAVLNEACKNPFNVSAEEINNFAAILDKDINRNSNDSENQTLLEIHNHIFQNYLYEYFGIELTRTPEEVERIFENASFEAEPTENIMKLLQFLDEVKIRTSIISNITLSGNMLESRVNRYLPGHKFESIITSSEYIFRKPHKRIFELALRKARLDASEVWYCGDNAVCDVDGAADCGIFPVWYNGALKKSNKHVPSRECLEISDWDELVKVLRKNYGVVNTLG